MIRSIQYNSELASKRWFGYFDLLGIGDLIDSGDDIDVFIPLSSTINQIRESAKGWDDVEYAWFSDTFIIYAKDDSYSSFDSICFISSWFVYFLISYNIPIRGAISCDQFYADTESTLFFGKALLEAYEYGEAQDWIGLLLCPSTVERAKILKKRDHQFFIKHQIPFKKTSKIQPQFLPACVIGNWVGSNGRNPIIKKLSQMRERITDQKTKAKYDRTIKFLKDNQRSW